MQELQKKDILTVLGVIGAIVAMVFWISKVDMPDPLVGVTQPMYFAEIDSKNVVKRVIVADQDFINSGAVGDPANWIQTSIDGKIRKHYAGIGYTYDKDIDAFVPQKEFASWKLNKTTAKWEAPTKMPNNGKKYRWDELRVKWEEISVTASQ